MTKWSSCLASLSALLALPGWSVGAQQPYCPSTCTGHIEGDHQGTHPGLALIVVVGTPTNGDGSPFCETCTPCRVGIAVSWDGNALDKCITVNHGGTGWTPPSKDYTRIGRFTSVCDGNWDCIELQIGDCGSIPGSFDYQ